MKRLSDKQIAITTYLKKHGLITLAQSVEIIGKNIYANAEKHVGSAMSRMVKSGIIIRIKPGVFALPSEDVDCVLLDLI